MGGPAGRRPLRLGGGGGSLPLRKEPVRTGTLRLIEVEDFDLSACGGTHVARTGAVGIIVAPGIEGFRGGARVQFLCGVRVRRRFDAWRDALASTQRYLSVAPDELAAAIERMQEENKDLQRALRGAQEKLAVHEAAALVARAERVGERLVVVEAIADLDAMALKGMASAAATHHGAAVVLFGAASPALVGRGQPPCGRCRRERHGQGAGGALWRKGRGQAPISPRGVDLSATPPRSWPPPARC